MSRAQRALARSRGVARTLVSLSHDAAVAPSLPVLPPPSPSPSPEPQLPALASAESSPHKRGKYKKLSKETREDIIHQYVNNGFAPKEIKGVLKEPTKLKTIYHVLSQFRKQQENDDSSSDEEEKSEQETRGRKPKFTAEEREYIVQQSDARHDITYRELSRLFERQFHKHISQGTISSILTDSGFTTKKLVLVPAQRNAPANIQKRKEFCERMSDVDEKTLLYVDETPMSLHMRRTRGRSRRGRRAMVVREGARSVNMTVIACFSPEIGLVYYKANTGGTTAAKYVEFMTELLKQPYLQLRSYSIIHDNAPIHKARELQQLMEGQRLRHTLVDMPPYSPQLSPIESMFSTWKHYIKQKESEALAERTQRNLLLWIDECSSEVKRRRKAAGWYRHVLRYYIHCVQSKPLDEKYSPHLIV